ncbi:tRNA (adenosine(37)-N6)-dimethylallyltransferase MiaA [Desulfonatronum thioautotrophicum]|uniref:tRNA (adenosine(37)-N6)-dimethylallyltransferase MiaA n=1 Tax=Desulfonatronum thioautotrophicum TaxID=617001 RepID=UPI0009FF1CAD|nr:tRNA (adenosine(37)-N6)-dimethylallyltransferase MiaA [Desulfonatronum thioautotrophicum]
MEREQPESGRSAGPVAVANGQPSRIICLVGATGTGKTAAALTLARHYPVSVVNADSRQVYRDVPIITAQPGDGEQSQCPHLLYGFLAMNETISAGRFMDEARQAVTACRESGRMPILVGGTGLYLRALAGGLADIPQVPAEVRGAVLEDCATQGSEALHARLTAVDPAYAARIHPRDRQRVCRALEVFQASGRPLSWWHTQARSAQGLDLCIIGLRLPRPELHDRLARRIDLMLELGALQEIQQAWDGCPDADAPGFSGIGCRELLAHVHGQKTLEEAKDLWLFRTRAYAKRQETWFNNIADVHWIPAGEPTAALRLVNSLVTNRPWSDGIE